MSRIGLVILTYRRPDVLRECLDSVLAQTVLLNHVVVVDNSEDALTERMMAAEFPSITYKRFEDNVGSAGGYHAGIQMALGTNDYVWILDDDVVCGPDAVRIMTDHLPALEQEERFGVLRNYVGEIVEEGVKELEGFPWRGTLIRADVIREVGLPKQEFFLYFSDVEYAMRIRRAGYRIFAIFPGQIKEHKPVPRSEVRVMGWTAGYYSEPFRLYYAMRNEMYMCRDYRERKRIVKLLLYGLRGMLLFVLRGNAASAAAIIAGLRDGVAGRMGKSEKYDPGEDNVAT